MHVILTYTGSTESMGMWEHAERKWYNEPVARGVRSPYFVARIPRTAILVTESIVYRRCHCFPESRQKAPSLQSSMRIPQP